MRVRGGGCLIPLAAAMLLSGALLVPGAAAAATVVNGDFESKTLNGWNVHRATQAGNWFAYKGKLDPIAKQRGRLFPQEPPQGEYAAIADEINPDTLILSQEVTLEPGRRHFLSLLAYYRSSVPIAVPAPDTLSVDGEVLAGRANQQFRIDVMRPGTPIESLDPADILLTAFQTRPGDPKEMPPARLTTDISALAGQAVRLRIAVAVHEELLTAGVDDVTISATPPGNGPSSSGPSRFSIGKARVNRKNGTAILPVQVPGPGFLSAQGKSAPGASASKAKKAVKLIKSASARARAAGTVLLHLKPTPPAREILKRKHKLRVIVAVTYTPTGGQRKAASVPVVLRLKAPRPHWH